MRIIDMHAHTGEFPGLIPGGHHGIDELLALWDEAGVQQGLISILDGHDPSGANDRCAALCAAHPDRVHGYVYLNPTDVAGSLRELERCAGMDCFVGVKLHPSNDAYFPFVDTYFPVYEAIERAGLPVLWHSGTFPYSHPLQIAVVARAFPGNTHILAHFGLADLSWECFPAAQLADNVVVDTSANPIIGVLSEWVQRFGAERMLWGSDFPFYDPVYERAKLDRLRLADAERELVAGGNAARLFGL